MKVRHAKRDLKTKARRQKGVRAQKSVQTKGVHMQKEMRKSKTIISMATTKWRPSNGLAAFEIKQIRATPFLPRT